MTWYTTNSSLQVEYESVNMWVRIPYWPMSDSGISKASYLLSAEIPSFFIVCFDLCILCKQLIMNLHKVFTGEGFHWQFCHLLIRTLTGFVDAFISSDIGSNYTRKSQCIRSCPSQIKSSSIRMHKSSTTDNQLEFRHVIWSYQNNIHLTSELSNFVT